MNYDDVRGIGMGSVSIDPLSELHTEVLFSPDVVRWRVGRSNIQVQVLRTVSPQRLGQFLAGTFDRGLSVSLQKRDHLRDLCNDRKWETHMKDPYGSMHRDTYCVNVHESMG